VEDVLWQRVQERMMAADQVDGGDGWMSAREHEADSGQEGQKEPFQREAGYIQSGTGRSAEEAREVVAPWTPERKEARERHQHEAGRQDVPAGAAPALRLFPLAFL
jgi:hypothetical protein